MDSLKEWVRDLVVLVLLGSILELLLPMNGMKKYVRMSMGLLVVLAVAKPLLSLVGRPIPLDGIRLPAEERQSLPTIAEITAEASQFRDRNRELVLTEARARLEAEAVQAARAVKGVKDARATVEVELKGTEPVIRRVTVTLLPGADQLMEPIRPVEPVQIGPDRREPVARPALTEAQRALADAVGREVAARLGIVAESQIIRVLVNGGT